MKNKYILFFILIFNFIFTCLNLSALTSRHHDFKKQIIKEIFSKKSQVMAIHKDKITEEHLFEYLSNSDVLIDKISSKRLNELKREFKQTKKEGAELVKFFNNYLLEKLDQDYKRFDYNSENIHSQFQHGDVIAFKRSNNRFNDGAFSSYLIYKSLTLGDNVLKRDRLTYGANHVSHLAIVIEIENEHQQKKLQIAELVLGFSKQENDLRRIAPEKDPLFEGEEYRLFRFFAEDEKLQTAVRQRIGNLAYLFTKNFEHHPSPPPPSTLGEYLKRIKYLFTHKFLFQTKEPGKNYNLITTFMGGVVKVKLKTKQKREIEELASYANINADANANANADNTENIKLPLQFIKEKTFCSLFSFKVVLASFFSAKEFFPGGQIPKYYLANPNAATPPYFYTYLKRDESRLTNKEASFGFKQIATFDPIFNDKEDEDNDNN